MPYPSTYTVCLLPVGKQTYDEIFHALQEAGYDHCIRNDGHGRIILDLHGIALARAKLTD
jgi:hypothetical protein